jgi:adenylate kinase
MIGRPGSGKGTQAVRISQHFGIAHLSSGELLRREVERATTVGGEVGESLAHGDLVSDDVVMTVLRGPVEAANRAGGYVLDGYPRTLTQAETAAKEPEFAIELAVYLEVPRDVLTARTIARAHEQGRTDDTLDVLHHRLEVFDDATVPLLDYYAKRDALISLDGTRDVGEVEADVIAAISSFFPTFPAPIKD